MKDWYWLMPDPRWGWERPKFDKLVRLGPMRFGLAGKLPSGERVIVELGRGPARAS